MRIGIDVKFLGGVAEGENLTGSCILLKIRRGKKNTTLLIDAGLLQGDFQNSITRNMAVLRQFKPSEVDYIIVTHSHIDHIGRIPMFVKAGFCGNIICTEATNNLMHVMLPDTARIQLSEIKYLNTIKKTQSKKEGFKNGNSRNRGRNKDSINAPLYTLDDVEDTYKLIKNEGFPYKKDIKLDIGINLKFFASGHVLGGAICLIKITRPGTTKHFYIGFSGDLGREDGIILPAPQTIKKFLNYWFVESTYGGKKHPHRQQEIDKIIKLVAEAATEGKRILIPSFALERTQEIIYILVYFMHIGKIPQIPIYLDSPLAQKITDVYAKNWEKHMFKDQGMLSFNPFLVNNQKNQYFKIITDPLESSSLSKAHHAHIVIAGSGMCDAGRIRNHLRENLNNDKTIVCLIGYMAAGSLGRKLKDGYPMVRINHQEIDVLARIESFESFSAHADSDFLVSYTNRIQPKNIFIIHGEELGAIALKSQLLRSSFGKNLKYHIEIPGLNQTFKLL
jgi:metallo-beta-lactamase family protein